MLRSVNFDPKLDLDAVVRRPWKERESMSPDNLALKTSHLENSDDAYLLEQFEHHRDFARSFFDGYVLLSADKRILKYNQNFCVIMNIKHREVQKYRTIDDLLRTQIPNTHETAIDRVLNSVAVQRIDEVQGYLVAADKEIQLILGSYPYLSKSGKLLGACVFLRDVTAEKNLQGKYTGAKNEANTDPLTGLYTRRYFEDWIDKEVLRAREQQRAVSIGVLMFDLDKFKSVNDNFGHQAGDFVLCETAKVLKASSRKSDILGRYGGEELIAILLNTTKQGNCAAAEKFRQAIENHVFLFDGKRIPVTTSVGVSSFLSLEESREVVIARADKCLYEAKHSGRNCVFSDFGKGLVKVTEENLSFLDD